MSAPQTVSQTLAQSAPANGGALATTGAAAPSSGNAFEQALFQFLQSNLADATGLEQTIEGVKLPSGGDKLPSPEAVFQQLSEALSPEQLEELQNLLNGATASEGVLSDELLTSVKGLLQGIESGDFSQEDVQQLKNGLAGDVQPKGPLELSSAREGVTASSFSNPNPSRGVDVSVEELALKSAQTDKKLADELAATSVGNNSVKGEQGALAVEKPAVVEGVNATVTQENVQSSIAETEESQQRFGSSQEAASAKASADAAAQGTIQSGVAPVASVAEQQRVNATVEARADAKTAPVAETSQPVSQQSTGQNSSGNQQQSESQRMREVLSAQRGEAGSRESVESARAVLGNSFVLSGPSTPEPVSRLNASLSGFQQLQQMYAGDSGSQVALSAGARFGTSAWTPNVSQRIAWMANQQVGRAEIRLDPPDLGMLNIRLTVQNDQASVTFVSPNPQVRDALEQQMPRLREMLEEAGIQLENGDVSAESGGREHGEGERSSTTAGLSEDGEVGVIANELSADSGNLSLVDYYA